MEKNKVLLSQSEIDTLLTFLIDNKTKIDSAIMDQESIDKLIILLQAKEKTQLRYDSILTTPNQLDSAFLVLPNNENYSDNTKNCRLSFTVSDSGRVEITCTADSRSYPITPACIERLHYLEDTTSSWGFCIAPILFASIASLLRVSYTKDTYTNVCRRFAEITYGDANAPIPAFYLPSDASLIEHLVLE